VHNPKEGGIAMSHPKSKVMVILAMVVLASVGCISVERTPSKRWLLVYDTTQPINVLTKDSLSYEFRSYGLIDSMLIGEAISRQSDSTTISRIVLPLSSIEYVETQSVNVFKTFIAIGVTAFIASNAITYLQSDDPGLVVSADIQTNYPPRSGGPGSCPFVYSFDGNGYTFDAEPLGGAICKGLARTDISRLDHMKPVNGEYNLLIRNEVPETQYVDHMNLLVVDHPIAAHVYPDLQGTFRAFTSLQGARSAFDEKGTNLMKFLRASDNVAWQTNLLSASNEEGEQVRHQLTVTFPKPAGTKKAWLVTNIGTSFWGSSMVRKTVEYRGNAAEEWLESVTPGSQSYNEMYALVEREEMYLLKTWVQEGASWVQKALVPGQGPIIRDETVYPIDISNVVGDSLKIRFNPPKGFWTFDYLGVSYEEPLVVQDIRVDARLGQDQHGVSILQSLQDLDSSYYQMPEIGDCAKLHFPVPPQSDGLARSVYLQTSGYYTLHLNLEQPDQLERLYAMWMNPGQIVKTALEEFRVWQSEMQASR
jgi:hypothetical protein